MASRGYAVFQPNCRGSSVYGMDFRTAGFGEWGRKRLSDISDGITELVWPFCQHVGARRATIELLSLHAEVSWTSHSQHGVMQH